MHLKSQSGREDASRLAAGHPEGSALTPRSG
jgi:hypothetical protein